MNEIISVGYDDEQQKTKAQVLANTLSLALAKDKTPCLYVTAEKLALKIERFALLFADFSARSWNKRKSEGKKQGLIRACKPIAGMKIIDATAGWGRDSALLASFGAEVLMLERHPIMAALLADALAQRDPIDLQKMQLALHQGDACSYLRSLEGLDYPDLIYIDPMHPERQKSALVKKDMQALQHLIGPDEDALELIKCALLHVKQRVVVKWPQKTKPLLAADYSIEGKTVRFDVYIPAL